MHLIIHKSHAEKHKSFRIQKEEEEKIVPHAWCIVSVMPHWNLHKINELNLLFQYPEEPAARIKS